MLREVLLQSGINAEPLQLLQFGTGLINNTWKVQSPDRNYILQKINSIVFKEPRDIGFNLDTIASYIKQHHPTYEFVAPLTASNGQTLLYKEGEGYFRLFPFIADSHAKEVVNSAAQAFEAAQQFGSFTQVLAGMDSGQLKITIPFFHNLTFRHQQFLQAIKNGDQLRIKGAETLINVLTGYTDIVRTYEAIKCNPKFRLRVTHHDTKISNVLFDAGEKGICVIDLDTVMPGYFISDVGDMMRTYLSPVSEEEPDTEKIFVREDIYKAIADGYCGQMKDELTNEEKKHFFYAGKFMIYMQAIRFLTDHLNNDVYYAVSYNEQNLVRATNQAVLLQRLTEKEAALSRYLCK
jgi:Ser/Thr protein kinase RdoA (MazF antagonist)